MEAWPLIQPWSTQFTKRKREPWDYRDQHQVPKAPRKRPKAIAEYYKCSAQQRDIYNQNSIISPLLRLPAEIRNLIYEYVLSNNVIHISVRECPQDDPGAWSHAQYYRTKRNPRRKYNDVQCLRFTHTLCTHHFDLEEHVNTPPKERIRAIEIPCKASGTTSYRIRHTSCYHRLSEQKINYVRSGPDVTISPSFYHPPNTPGLAVAFLRTSRQVYSECRDLIYIGNTFAFHEGFTLDLWASKALSAYQRGLVRRVQVDGWMYEEYDPGSRVQENTLQSLTGLESFMVAVTNTYETFHKSRLNNSRDGIIIHRCNNGGCKGSSFEWRIQGSTGGEGKAAFKEGVVKVIVDKLESGWNDIQELERLVRGNVEAILGAGCVDDMCKMRSRH